jgi:hypothetical protein
MRWLSLFLVGVLVHALVASCNDGQGLLRAKVIEDRSELVGGPVAMADIGDFLLENDQIRVAILRAVDSPGPGVFGGSIVDMDRRRPLLGFEGGHGRDRFAETFPIANLMVPEPDRVDIRVIHDGSDGVQATIRVEGDGEFLFEALGILRSKQPILDLLFPDVRTRIRFSTDYSVRPGDRHVLARTVLMLPEVQPPGCAPVQCGEDCPFGLAQDESGCLICACSEALPLEKYAEPVSVFGRILGDNPGEAAAVIRAGIVAGDFVFFGNQNDVFAPGPGFDEDFAVQSAANAGQNTFQEPLVYDFVAAAGGDVSYGYFTKADPGAAPPVVNVPLFASAATTFLAAGKNCLYDESDDETCDRHRAYVFERYLVVGDGDVASVTEEMHRVRGTPVGTLEGHVLWASTGEPVKNARLFVFSDPDPERDYADVDALVEANLEARGDYGVLNAIDADLGLDTLEDGDFRGVMPPGRYVVVARDSAATATSEPLKVRVREGESVRLLPVLEVPATIAYRVTDAGGQRIPAKITLVALDGKGKPLEGDGRRRPYLGEDRRGNGVRHVELTASGAGEMRVEPGRYRILVSRGIEYGLHREDDVTLAPGRVFHLDAVVRHEVDTTGWLSADMHLHSTPSFDSGLPVAARVTAAAAEGVELAVSTDHDVSTLYEPVVRQLGLEPFMKTVVGAEITTLEQGHFIGFPLVYNELVVPTHGAHDWTCQGGQEIIDGIRAIGEGIEPFTIVAHPRDGFFGYLDQLGVDTYTMNRRPTLLEEENPVFRIAGCDYDAMELISAKRYDLTRTPTVGEMVDWARCLARLDAAADLEALAAACPELGPGLVAPCVEGERFARCRDRNRTRLAWEMQKRMLAREPAEQFADMSWPDTQEASQALCDPASFGTDPVPTAIADQPCAYRPGQVDDLFRLIERGMTPTQIGSSDSHGGGKEPGYPRTYFRSPTDSPGVLDIGEAVASLRGGHAFATYGPFVRASIAGKTFGEVAKGKAGGEVVLDLDVLTPSWFGVDRVEIYLNGDLRRVVLPESEPEDIVDVHGKVTLKLPDRDSWVIVIAMGLDDENLLGPISLDVPFGEVQLSKIAADAFGKIPVVNEIFNAPPTAPDWTPIAPLAITNPIYIDVDDNGRYDAPLPRPDFCSRPCDPGAGGADCPTGQTCLSKERLCGFEIAGRCERRVASGHGH